MRRRYLGGWTCRSGNSLDIFLEAGSSGATCHVRLGWDSPPRSAPRTKSTTTQNLARGRSARGSISNGLAQSSWCACEGPGSLLSVDVIPDALRLRPQWVAAV